MNPICKYLIRALASVSLCLLLCASWGCAKYSVECELVVQPYTMIGSGSDPRTPSYMARVYAWYVSEADARDFNWRPESWADADAGVVRHKVSGEVRSHGQMARQGDDNYVHLTLSQSPVVLVAVDPVNKMYAWRVFKYEMPLSKIYVPVSFKAWLTERYKENDWTVQKVEN